MSFSKKTYARGIGEACQRSGIIQYPDGNLLKEACDMFSVHLETDPAVASVPHAEAIKVAQELVLYNDELRAHGKTASAGRPIIGESAHTAFGDLIYKIAEAATSGTGSTLGGGGVANQPNTLTNAASAEAKVLESHRGENYAVVGEGNANFSEPQAARVGTEQPHPMAPQSAGTNSVEAASKAAALAAKLRKMAEGAYGSTIVGGDPDQQNTQADSVTGEAAMDASYRPENYAVVGEGNANIDSAPDSAAVGTEEPHPAGPAPITAGAATNSVIESSKTGAARWNAHFQETAKEVAPYLPEAMPTNQKVAAIKEAMKMEPSELDQFLAAINREYGTNNTVNSVLSSIGISR